VHNKAIQSQYHAATVKCTLKEQRKSKLIKSTAPTYQQEITTQKLFTKKSQYTVTHTKKKV